MHSNRQSLLLEKVDIFQLPAVDEKHPGDKGAQLTIGDLHANTIKLLFMLLKHGVASGVTQEMYADLVKIYQRVSTQKNLEQYNQTVDAIKFIAAATIRLIGDEVGDRGSNDYYTLKLLQKMLAEQMPVEILLSNHGFEFIEAYEKYGHFTHSYLGEQSISMIRLQAMINNGLVTQQEVNQLINTVYKPCLKVLSYSLDPGNTEITLYTHAPVGFNIVRDLAEKLGVPYRDETPIDLAGTIDNINSKFQIFVQTNTVHSLNDHSETNPFQRIMWNRNYKAIERPEVVNNYKVNYVHGHDSTHPSKGHVFNLDNQLGKTPHLNNEEYSVLYSHDTKLEPRESTSLEKNSIDIISSQSLKSQLAVIRQKAGNLRERSFINAANMAEMLCVDIEKTYQYYQDAMINKEEFVAISAAKISAAELTLNDHRGWKQTLATLGLAVLGIVTLSIGFFTACLINLAVTGGKHFFFPLKTDTGEKLEPLKGIVAKL